MKFKGVRAGKHRSTTIKLITEDTEGQSGLGQNSQESMYQEAMEKLFHGEMSNSTNKVIREF